MGGTEATACITLIMTAVLTVAAGTSREIVPTEFYLSMKSDLQKC